MTDVNRSGDRVRDEFYGWWLCTDGDAFPTREEAIQHLQMARWSETTGRLKPYTAEFEDEDPYEGEWEEVQL